MGKKLPKSINLIETLSPPGDTFTIFYEWSFTIGKYLLIFVQIIIIVVFIIRLSVDKINNDLTDDINNQVEFLLQAGVRENETRYRNLQIFLKDLDYLSENQVKNARVIISILDNIPAGIRLETFSFHNNMVSSDFYGTPPEDIQNYENFLKQNPNYSDVKMSVEVIDDDEYEFSATYIVGREDEE